MLFSGMVFLVSQYVCPSTIATVHRHGGRVVYAFNDSVSCGIQASSAIAEFSTKGLDGGNDDAQMMQKYLLLMRTLDSFPDVDELRSNRLFIVYESWVVESALHRRFLPLHPLDTQHVAYHPFSMHGLSFTTSQLPEAIKANVVAALQYCGAHYTPHLDGRTQLVVYSRLLGSRASARHRPQSAQWCAIEKLSGEAQKENSPKCEEGTLTRVEENCSDSDMFCDREALGWSSGICSSKQEIAQAVRIPCVTPSWVELCVRLGRRLPFGSEGSCSSLASFLLRASSTTLLKRQREEGLFYGNLNCERKKIAQ